jgi:TonB-linked SusC/RagA family outer membrane protein
MQIYKTRKWGLRLLPPVLITRIMKLTAVFLLAISMNVSAIGYPQEVTLHLSHTSLENVFKHIRKQTGYVFFYKSNILKGVPNVTIAVNKASVKETMELCLLSLPLSYTIIDQTIVVRAKESSKPEKVLTEIMLPDLQVTGKVTTANGEALAGATIRLKNSETGTATDVNGNFTLSIPSAGGVLVISFVGYETQERAVTKAGNLSIVLSQKDNRVEEVVIIGYGAVKRSGLTGSVSSVSSEKITQVKAVSTVAGALQGQAAGVQVIQRSGQPGDAVSIKIRGTNSIAGGNDVLYVVDGLPLDGLSAQLNPADIESIEVLKDASSTAIYGSRGANGVVMITTKKGKEGKVKVSYNGYYGVQSLRKKMKLINAHEFASLQNEANTNWNTDNPTLLPKTLWTSSQIDSLGAQGTDWQDLVYRKAPVHSHDLSISGGSGGTRFYTSFGYFDQDGIIQNSGFKRYSFRGNLDQKISEKLSTNISLSLQQSNYSQNNYFNADGSGGVPFTTMVMPPTQGVYDKTGNYTVFTGVSWGQTNPYAIAREEYRFNPSLRLLGNVSLSYAIMDGLKLKLSAGVDNSWNRSDYYAPSTLSLYVNGGASQSYSNSSTFVNENLLNYNKTFHKHAIDAVAGITYQASKSQNLSSGTGTGFLTDIYQDNNIGAATVKAQPGTGYNDNKLISYLGRINYGYAGKYLLTVTSRYDGSSRFSENHKYGFFPSGALAWRISEETFMKDVRAVSNLKLRGSYGLSGNQAIGNYQTLGQLSNQNIILNNAPVTVYYLSRLENKNLKWETTKQMDIGFDLGLFNERIQLTADYYDKKTTDLLLNVTLPTSSGYSSVLKNVGAVGNKGYEFQLNTKNIIGAFAWSSTITFSHNKTKILDLGKDAQGNPITYKEVGTGGNWFPMILGQSMQQLFGYKVLGVYQSNDEAVANGEPTKKAGDYKFQTTQGVILPNDNRVLLSHFEPKFTFGFNNNFSYKSFNLSILLVGSYGNDIANEFRKYNITLNGKWTPTQEAYDNRYIAGKGTNKFDRPQYDNSGSSIRDYANSLWIENGSYLRFRDITLGYDFGPSILKSSRISSLQVYISAQNYITLTRYSGYDPEAAWQSASINGWDRGSYPSSKSITGGVKINF